MGTAGATKPHRDVVLMSNDAHALSVQHGGLERNKLVSHHSRCMNTLYYSMGHRYHYVGAGIRPELMADSKMIWF